jgi:hypothetical protein
MIGTAHVSRRPTSVSASVLGLLACVAATLALSATPALGAACPNEQLRQESNTNPATGKPYSTGLPDCRGYEMVSPPYKQSHVAESPETGLPVAPAGDVAGFMSEGAFSGPENNLGGFAVINVYTSHRGTSGWSTSSAFPPVNLMPKPPQTGLSSDFSPDLRSAQASCGAAPPGKVETVPGRVVCAKRTLGGSWVPTPFYATPPNITIANAGFMGSSRDLSRILIQPERPLLPYDITGQSTFAGIYEVAGVGTESPTLRLVNVEGPFESEKELVIHKGSQIQGPLVGDRRLSQKVAGTDYHAISESGETVFFTATPEGSEKLTVYARVEGATASAHTVVVSAQSPSCEGPCASSAPANAIFQGASADGSKVFFTTAQKLLNSDTNTNTDLYEYEFNPAGNKLILISGGMPEQVAAGVVRSSPDGSHVYFVELGVLTPGEKNGTGEEAGTGENLYGYDTVTHETKFVARTGANKGGFIVSTDEERHAQTTPDGRYLVFSSPGALAGDTNSAPAQAVYRYDFQTGELTWVSQAAPSLKAENGGNNPNEGKDALVAPLPGTNGGAEATIDDWNRAISENGEYIIFTTTEKLQANDVNEAADVYEWHNGTVSIVSDGHNPAGVIAGGAGKGGSAMSASGSDIFFFTHAKLVGQDTDALGDLYDARVGGGFPAPEQERPCFDEACQGNSSPLPSFGSAASSLFTAGRNLPPGSGSVLGFQISKPKPLTRAQQLSKALKACKKKRNKKQRATCESQARKKYAGKAKAKKGARRGH